MKPLLRVVLIVDALMLLGFGVLFLLTPWTMLYDTLQLVQPQPALVGIVLGIALFGLAWLAVHAAFDGALTVAVGRGVGHVGWVCGVAMLVWLLGLHRPMLTGYGELVTGGVGAWLIVIGMGGVRLASAVRQREKVQAAADAAARREAEAVAKEQARVAAAREEARVAAAQQEARVAAEQEARAAAEQQARLAAEQQARLAAEQQARLAAEQQARAAAEQQAANAAQLDLPREPVSYTTPVVVTQPAPVMPETPAPVVTPAPSAATEEARHAAATGTPRRPVGG